MSLITAGCKRYKYSENPLFFFWGLSLYTFWMRCNVATCSTPRDAALPSSETIMVQSNTHNAWNESDFQVLTYR